MNKRSNYNRSDRVRKAVIREVSDIIAREVKDPYLTDKLISVTDVELSADLRYAKVFVSIMGDEATQREVMDILNEAAPQIRFALGQRVRLRHTPEILIRQDDSLERGSRVTDLLNRISRGEEEV